MNVPNNDNAMAVLIRLAKSEDLEGGNAKASGINPSCV